MCVYIYILPFSIMGIKVAFVGFKQSPVHTLLQQECISRIFLRPLWWCLSYRRLIYLSVSAPHNKDQKPLGSSLAQAPNT